MLAGALGLAISAAGMLSSLAQPAATASPVAVADALRASTWAMTIPAGWLVAPPPRVRPGDALDILAVRPGDRGYTVPVAYAVTVVAVDDRGLVVEVNEDDAIALTNARGGGMLLVPLLRSTR